MGVGKERGGMDYRILFKKINRNFKKNKERKTGKKKITEFFLVFPQIRKDLFLSQGNKEKVTNNKYWYIFTQPLHTSKMWHKVNF